MKNNNNYYYFARMRIFAYNNICIHHAAKRRSRKGGGRPEGEPKGLEELQHIMIDPGSWPLLPWLRDNETGQPRTDSESSP